MKELATASFILFVLSNSKEGVWIFIGK